MEAISRPQAELPKQLNAVMDFVDFHTELSPIILNTPQSSWDVWNLARSLREIDPEFGKPVARQLFGKLAKSLDNHILKNTMIEARIEALQHSIDRLRPRKRRRVLPAPNNDFVQLADVLRVRRAMGVIPDSEGEEEEETEEIIKNEDNSVIEDCIEVKDDESGSNYSDGE
jgi:hypothetical protein